MGGAANEGPFVWEEGMRMELDLGSYSKETGAVKGAVRGVEVVCYDSKPWDVFDSLSDVSDIIGVSVTLDKVVAVLGTREGVGCSEELVQVEAQVLIVGNFLNGMSLRGARAKAVMSIAQRLDKVLSKVMPVESFLGRARHLKSGARTMRYEVNEKWDGAVGVKSTSSPHLYKLAAMYKTCHMERTNQTLDHNRSSEESLSSLEVLTEKWTGERVIRPKSSAKRAAMKSLNAEEGRIQREHFNASSCLCSLPLSLVEMVSGFLDACTLRVLRSSCKYIHYVCSPVVPGLKMELYSHQRDGLRWMDEQENVGVEKTSSTLGGVEISPCFIHLPRQLCYEDRQLSLDIVSGKVIRDDPSEGLLSARRVVVGGLLCDEPGLGKTITMLSLVLRSAGVVPRSMELNEYEKRVQLETEIYKMDVVWEGMDKITRQRLQEDIFRDLLQMIRSHRFVDPTVRKGFELSADAVNPQYLAGGGNFDRLSEWLDHVRVWIENSHLWFPHPTIHYGCRWFAPTKAILSNFDELVERTRSRYQPGRERSRRRSSIQPDRTEDKPSLLRSPATLVVVPKTLLSHWKNQVETHIDPKFFPPKLFYFDTDPKSSLPAAKDLAKYVAVFTTTSRLSREEGTLRKRKAESPLQQLHWLRVIMDEGHCLGACTQTLYGNFLNNLVAERRWVMTGTPAKETSLRAGLRSILGLVRFLKVAPYGLPRGSIQWNALVSSPLEKRHPVGVPQLVALLVRTMIRHTKIDVAELPPLVLKSVPLTMASTERDSYNSIVSYGRANIALTGLGELGFESSLLNPSNQKLSQELMRNVRLSTAGGGHMQAEIHDNDWVETRQLLQDVHGASTTDIRRANFFITRVVQNQPTKCDGCGIELSMMLLTPCVHFMCVECFEKNCAEPNQFSCLRCSRDFDPDEFAALQPGFRLSWVGDDPSKDRASMSSWQQQQLLSEYQRTPSLLENEDISSKAGYIVQKLSTLKQQEGKHGFKCILYSQFRSVLNVLGHHLIQAFGPDTVAEFWGARRQMELAKYTHNVAYSWKCSACGFANDPIFKRCEQSRLAVKREIDSLGTHSEEVLASDVNNWFPGKRYQNGDVVYFARFQGTVTKVTPCPGKQNTGHFFKRPDLDCSILLLSKDGSTGLDLSMTTHIFLVDKIWDPAVEDQVISRAWRLGTKVSKVNVEQIYMKDTVEELMFDWKHHQNDSEEEDENSQEVLGKDFGKLRYLLKEMRVIRPSHVDISTKSKRSSSHSENINPIKRVRFAVQE
eukprot:CAMPEP_0203753102 /NCGR_PEP_ID=MMETSP0098-20131031/6920_1 /ASSEMBLY_ACC=CAM_ASM_000208 /TAXON_ID=96639 /ORGANISM=" , Strain NY0313808BC1" /LENGTH=1259 /DNA_ID=CAMNT_0050643553 /DNA_START=163 /DNA_END=3942 /DNA_ORIENTATION=+